MFTNEMDTRDLFFSNPMDVFLSQDHSNKTKYESGISSTFSGYNQTGNSTEVRCRSSQDLFSQFEKTESQYEANKSGYQKYISQNLLMGKDPPPKGQRTLRVEDETRKKMKPISPPREDQVKDIRQSLDALNESVKQLNSEIGLHNDKVNFLQEEVFKLNEKVTNVEKFIEKKLEFSDENYKVVIKLIKKEVFSKIEETNKNVRKVENKVDGCTEQSKKILKEAIKNMSKSQETANKKQLQNIQTLFSKIDDTVEKMDAILNTSVKDIKSSFEKTSEQNMQSLKNCISNSMQQMVVSSNNQDRNSLVPQKKLSVLQDNMYAAKNKRTPFTAENGNYRHNGVIMKNKSQTIPQNHLRQTPLAYYIDSHENSNNRNIKNFKARSNNTPETPEYNDGFCFPNLNVRRKFSTPLSKLMSPYQAKLKPKSNPDWEPAIKRRMNLNYSSTHQRNPTHFIRDRNESDEMDPSESSTPAFSVFQATRLAKEYTSSLW